VSSNFLDVMEVRPRAGRLFSSQDETVAVLSSRLAERLYGDAQTAVGRALVTPERSYEVIGVMPSGFTYPAWADLWIPLRGLPAEAAYALTQRDLHVDSDAIVRLKPGVSAAQAQALIRAPIAHAAVTFPEPGSRFDRGALTPLRERVVGDVMPRLSVLLGAVVLVLLLACVNVAGLLLARGLGRRDELSVRLALGAGRRRLISQLLTESTLLALIGALPGVLLANVAVRGLKQGAPSLLPRMHEIGLDGSVVLFALGVTLASGVLFGTLPALRAVAGAARGELRAGMRSPTADTGAGRLRGGLVVAQISIAVVLLIGATLLVRSARTLSEADVGFEPEGLIVLRVFPSEQYSDAARLRLYEQLQEALARVPGVQRSSLVNHVPLSGAAMVTSVRTERVTGPDDNTLAYYRSVSTDYLAALGARPLRGRLLVAEDAHATGIVVNRTLARREWGDADPVGRSITVFRASQGAAGFGEPLPSRVVGMIADIRERGPDVEPPPTVYVPIERNVWTNITIVVRTTSEPTAIIPSLRAAVSAVDPDIPVAGPGFVDQFRPLSDYAAQSTATRRFVTNLLTAFALLAVVLSIVGLFGAMAYLVTQRTRELGLRMALGARPVDTAAMVVRQSVLLVGLGLTVGVAAAIPASSVLESLLFGVPRHDMLSYTGAVAVFVATGALAAYVPARRAARIEPVRALREG
jgi:predicted permease